MVLVSEQDELIPLAIGGRYSVNCEYMEILRKSEELVVGFGTVRSRVQSTA
jgi:hypothetical protein